MPEARAATIDGQVIKAVIFGAGQHGREAVTKISDRFAVTAFVDNDDTKWGMTCVGLPVCRPDSLLDKYADQHVIIASLQFHREIALQLHDLGIAEFSILLRREDGTYHLHETEAALFHSTVMEDYERSWRDMGALELTNDELPFDADAPRAFFITVFDFCEKCGGPAGVMARLRSQNLLEGAISNSVFVFGDRAYLPHQFSAGTPSLTRNAVVSRAAARLVELLQGRALEQRFSQVLIGTMNWLECKKSRILELHERLAFRNDDQYIFHDVQSAFLFGLIFDFANTMVVCHNQGAMYYEYRALGGAEDNAMESLFLAMQRFALSKCKMNAFPALGAKQALLATEPRLREHIHHVRILHNGCDILRDPHPTAFAKSLLSPAGTDSSTLFITVATLNQAKAVERIPRFLSDARSKGLDHFKWILIGNGPMQEELAEAVAKFDLAEHLYWVRDRMANEDIQYLMSKADYYLSLQRFAIFDFATLEAMGHGCIPVLSNAYGNKEFVCLDNGLLIDNFNDASQFLELHTSQQREEYGQRNRTAHLLHFSAHALLQRYCDAREELRTCDVST